MFWRRVNLSSWQTVWSTSPSFTSCVETGTQISPKPQLPPNWDLLSAEMQGRPLYCAGNRDRGAHKQLTCLLRSLRLCLCECITNLSGFCRQVTWGLTHPPLLTNPHSTLTSRDSESWVTAVQVHILNNIHGKAGWKCACSLAVHF